MVYQVILSQDFEKELLRCDKNVETRMAKIIRQLQEKGNSVGDPLAGFHFLREKRINGKRVYFLVYQELQIIILVGISDKKGQQGAIQNIIRNKQQYQQDAMNKLG